MGNNKLISYKENIFTKTLNFFKNLFFRKKKDTNKSIEELLIYNNQCKENFIDNILIKEDEDEEEKRLKMLQLQYDNEEIDEEDMSDEDIDNLCKLYEKE